ncbi:hypothetical protein J8J14_10425 [Roseomonas sp. SSH11]|uniref:Uncharacterized protein n=1 Tax=Pararoseomonas baculiformis TaxID=2820812 RepID=A0ABS4AF95_9PROT|nr:hypothetical protein [Pararoseomonas baculiformis]MBP0445195.1 hypothetical protein [Pararoseomonas baculiformis]
MKLKDDPDARACWLRREQAKAERERCKALSRKHQPAVIDAGQIWSFAARYLNARAALCEEQAARLAEIRLDRQPKEGSGKHALVH